MRLLQGRDVGPQDDESGPRTVVVNESLARAYFGEENPIGRRISIGREARRQRLEIVGVVADAKYQRLQEAPRRIAYLSLRQFHEFIGGGNLVASVRTAGAPSAVAGVVRREVRALDPAVPIRMETVADRIRESLVTERVLAILGVVLGGIALLIAAAGLYGLMAHMNYRQSVIGESAIGIGNRQNRGIAVTLSGDPTV
jgi:hypothetical protein